MELSLTAPFADVQGLRAAHPEAVHAIDGWSVAGPVRSRVFRGGELRLGSIIVSGVVTSMAAEDRGSLADSAYDGNIGSKLLKRFIVTFDYGRRRIHFKLLPEPVADSGSYDRCGLWINAVDGAFEIVGVSGNGPAAEAGLKTGERIVAVDGLPAQSVALADLRLRLRNDAPGTAVNFLVGEGDAGRPVAVLLRDQI